MASRTEVLGQTAENALIVSSAVIIKTDSNTYVWFRHVYLFRR